MSVSRREFMAGAVAALALSERLRAAEERALVPWLSEVQTPPPTLPADAPALSPLLVEEGGGAIASREAWERRRDRVRAWWLQFLGAYHDRRETPKFTVVEEDRPDGVIRQRIRYNVEAGWPVEAYLLRPAASERPCPGAVVLHSTTTNTIRQPAGLQGEPEKAFGLKLAQRGYVAICPRCFLWSEDLRVPYLTHVDRFRAGHPGSLGMAKMLFDAIVATDVLCSLPEVDRSRVAAVGHSLGAKEVLYLAAFDERIRATVSSEGGVGTKFSNWDAPWYLGPDLDRRLAGHEHHELLALVAPRAFLLLGGDSADGARSWPFIGAALPVYRLYEPPPRVGLFNHRAGHEVPPVAEQRVYEWLEACL